MSDTIDRTFVGMRNALFDSWDKIRSGTSDYREVEAVAKLANSISKSVDMELKAFKLFGQQQEKAAVQESQKFLTLGVNPSPAKK